MRQRLVFRLGESRSPDRFVCLREAVPASRPGLTPTAHKDALVEMIQAAAPQFDGTGVMAAR